MRRAGTFDKYDLYRRAVQAPADDVIFIRDTYRELTGKRPRVLREDFCGTFSICCEWVKLSRDFIANGVDLDPEPVDYGMRHYLPKLSESERRRVLIRMGNVLDEGLPRADVICAMNFSHYILKTRVAMLRYFRNCHESLNRGGVFLADSFGGSLCQGANEEITSHRGFKYYWNQESFDPVTNHAMFHIHFKPDGKPKLEKVFSYDWRMWSIPELRELMHEAGFRKTHVYWEGTARDGSGNGIFTRTETGEECQAWIAYVVGEK